MVLSFYSCKINEGSGIRDDSGNCASDVVVNLVICGYFAELFEGNGLHEL